MQPQERHFVRRNGDGRTYRGRLLPLEFGLIVNRVAAAGERFDFCRVWTPPLRFHSHGKPLFHQNFPFRGRPMLPSLAPCLHGVLRQGTRVLWPQRRPYRYKERGLPGVGGADQQQQALFRPSPEASPQAPPEELSQTWLKMFSEPVHRRVFRSGGIGYW